MSTRPPYNSRKDALRCAVIEPGHTYSSVTDKN